MRFLVQYPRGHSTAIILRWPVFHNMIECKHSQCIPVQSTRNSPFMKTVPLEFTCFGTSTELHFRRVFPVSSMATKTSDSRTYPNANYGANFGVEDYGSDKVLLEYQSAESSTDFDKKTTGKKRTEHGNKGKVPWNKGRTHSAETRAWISQRTVEALRDPKIREKLRRSKGVLSDQIKAKIASSQRRRWAELLKWKCLSDEVLFPWAKSIAEAARKGGISEEALHWDSCDRIRRETCGEPIQCFTEMENAKEVKRNRVKRAAQGMKKLGEKKGHEQAPEGTPELKGEMIQKRRRGNLEARNLNLRARLAEIPGEKFVNGQPVTSQGITVSRCPSMEKLDLKLTRKVKVQERVSLADQLCAIKSKRKQSACIEASTVSSDS